MKVYALIDRARAEQLKLKSSASVILIERQTPRNVPELLGRGTEGADCMHSDESFWRTSLFQTHLNCTQDRNVHVGRAFHYIVADRAVHVDTKQASSQSCMFEVMS
jgi:hypothetical protein